MTQVVASNTNNTVKVYSVGLQGAPGTPGPSGSLQSSNSGSFSITGSLTVSGSNTFTNIGPAIFSGSVISTGGFTGSLAGTSTTASYISPTFISASAAASGFGGGGSTNTGSLMVTGSVSSATLTFTKGDNSTFPLTINNVNNATSASFSSTAASASFATTASFALNAGTTVSTASFLVTASANSNTITFTKGDASTFAVTVNTGSGGGGGSTDTGSFFVSASSYGPSGSIIFTQGGGGTQTVTVGSSLVSALLPNSEIIVSPTQSYGLIGTDSIDTFPEFKNLDPQNFQYSWGTAAQPANMATFMFRDDTNSEWGGVSTGNYIAFNSFGNSNLPSYYEVNYATHNSSSYGLIRLFTVTAVDPDNQFSATNSASFQGSVSIPNAAYPSRISLGKYGGSFFPSTNLATNYTNQVALVSGSTPSGSWLYIGNTPSSGSQFSATAGQYIGLSTNTSSFTYYVVNGESYINASSDYFIGITPVAGEYFAATNTDVFIESARWIPAQPYYNSLSHITYPITPTSTADASGSIGDISYDNNNFYVKRQIGWGKAPLLDINSGSLLTTASVSDATLTFTKSDGSTFNLTVNTGSSGTTPTLAQVTAQGSTTGDALTIQGMTFKSGSTLPGLTANSVFVGYQAGNSSDNNASLNVGVGYRAMLNNNTTQNIALGANSLENGTVGENIGIGYLSVSNVKAGQNIGIGGLTLRYVYSGSQNTVIGSQALSFSTTTENESSSNKSGNVVIGYGALFSAVRSNQNTIIGTLSHSNVTSMGQFNTAIGSSNISSGSFNIILGAGNNILGYGENSIVIGNNHNLNNLNNSVIIGNPGAIKLRSTGNVTTLFEDTVISGSLTISSSEVLTLVPVNPLPSGVATGSFAVSGSIPPRPYFFDGTSWIALI